LRHSEQRFRDYAEIASDWFWETGPDHRFTYLSDRVATFGLSETGRIGRHRWDIASDFSDQSEKWRAHLDTINRHEPFRAFIYEIFRDDGSTGFVDVSGKPVFDATGRFLGYRGGARDVSAAVRADQALLEAKELAEAANRAKSEFLANMSHELRTPLNAIIGLSEMIKMEILGPIGNEQYRSYAGNIHTSGRHLLGIINEVLDVAKIEARAVELNEGELELGGVVTEVVRILDTQVQAAGLTISVEVAPDLPRLWADEQAIHRIMFNLLSNAFKFTPRDGRITVALQQTPSGEIKLSVTDTGIGIAAEHLSKLMHPFVQVENTYQRKHHGSGLGLALVRSLVELHGGSIAIESAPAMGTCVTVIFPASRVLPR
jgi:two-component system cell cycle sensor histidine kinase PleC